MSVKLSQTTTVPQIKGFEKAEEHLKTRLMLTNFEITSGKNGDYAIMDVKDPAPRAKLKVFQVSCGARQVMDTLGDLGLPLEEPIEFMFYKVGRMIGIKDYEPEPEPEPES